MDQINYEELAQEVIKQQQSREQAPQEHKEAVISVLQEKMRQQIPTYQPHPITISTQSASVHTQALTDNNLPAYAATAPTETIDRVRHLVALTFEKGISHGVMEVAHDDPFIIDMYHDALADHVVEKMKEKGLL